MPDTEVLIAGAGPIGLTAGLELRRRGVDVRIVDPLLEPPQYAKAVGVQPRTLEVFESMGVVRDILDAGREMRGQVIYRNGEEVGRVDISLPADVPYRFHLIPQYATERVLSAHLSTTGTRIERGTRVTGFEQDADGVTVGLSTSQGEEAVRASYLVGCDGAHSIVRKTLGLDFRGGAFDEQYMLGDVVIDWSLPGGYAVRSTRQVDDAPDDILVCIPLPGHGRYRMSMLVPEDLAVHRSSAADGVEHGFEGDRRPGLAHIQAVVDRLAPEPATVSNLRWSSVFRISHRIVDSYGRGRVFVAGDAAHIHPPTGAQGMNTGIQDAHNLAWKLALAVQGEAAPGLLESYDAERRPVGEEVVGRTVRNAREGVGADSTDIDFVMRREAQLLITYADSPIVAEPEPGIDDRAPQPGDRAPDAAALTRESVNHPVRLLPALDSTAHTVIVYAGDESGPEDVLRFEGLAAELVTAGLGCVHVRVVAAPAAQVGTTDLPLMRDTQGRFAAAYLPSATTSFVLRPDGYLAFRRAGVDIAGIIDSLRSTFRH